MAGTDGSAGRPLGASSRGDNLPTRELRAGPIALLLDGTDLRRIGAGHTELVQRLYPAVRDAVWGTVQPVLSGYDIVDAGDSFRVRFEARFRQDDLDFSASIAYEGLPDGTVRAEVDGVANSDFSYCRIGFCVLHGLSCAARPYRARSGEDWQEGALPDLVAPQRLIDGKLHPLFPSYDHLEIDLPDGPVVRFDFEGDLFEMEDQRNWTDASFKTYSTPLALGFPHQAARGGSFHQQVQISAANLPGETAIDGSAVELSLGESVRRGLPALGFGMSSVADTIGEREALLLRRTRPSHLRADLHLADPAGASIVQQAASAASALDTGLELAIFLSDDLEVELDRLSSLVRDLPVRRFLIFREGTPCSDGSLVAAVKARLRSEHPKAWYAGGTNVYFSDLNRFRPDLTGADAVVFPVVPSVHAIDNLSLMENLQAQADVVRTARVIAGDLPVVVSPVTIKPRFNPFASSEKTQSDDPLAAVDPRQATDFGAVWTLGSLKYLTEAGAASATYYETLGWRGLIECAQGSPLPEAFPSDPGMIFPLYWVFADLAEWQDAEVLACSSSDPAAVIGLAVRQGRRVRILAGNLTAATQRVFTGALPAMETTVRDLEDHPPREVAPESAGGAGRMAGGALELGPYAVARIDVMLE